MVSLRSNKLGDCYIARAYIFASRREDADSACDLHKKIIFILFVPVILKMYSLGPFSKSYKSRLFIAHIFRREM